MSADNERYTKAAEKFDEAYNQYAGEKGLNWATQYGQQQAEQQSARAGNQAAAAATKAARNAGLTQAQSAAMGAQGASDTAGNAYQNIYDNSRNAALGSALGAINARGQAMSAAQQQEQNIWNRWGTGIGALAQLGGAAILASDENLKTAENVSSDKKKLSPQQALGMGLANAGSVLAGSSPSYKWEDITDETRDGRQWASEALSNVGASIASDERLKDKIDGKAILKVLIKTDDEDMFNKALKKLRGDK